MSEKYGMMALETNTNPYLGDDTILTCSSATAADIDSEVKEIISRSYEQAKQMISDNIVKMHKPANFLLEKETITGEEFMQILKQE